MSESKGKDEDMRVLYNLLCFY